MFGVRASLTRKGGVAQWAVWCRRWLGKGLRSFPWLPYKIRSNGCPSFYGTFGLELRGLEGSLASGSGAPSNTSQFKSSAMLGLEVKTVGGNTLHHKQSERHVA